MEQLDHLRRPARCVERVYVCVPGSVSGSSPRACNRGLGSGACDGHCIAAPPPARSSHPSLVHFLCAGIYGDLDRMATSPYADKKNSKHMVGIGFTPEATGGCSLVFTQCLCHSLEVRVLQARGEKRHVQECDTPISMQHVMVSKLMMTAFVLIALIIPLQR